VQFDHRVLATLTAITALAAAVAGLRGAPPRDTRMAFLTLGGAVIIQYVLGVTTLLHAVPVDLAVAHQACAVLVLTAALAAWHSCAGRQRR
jgi:cytochrome c oxidase assembly protein subunit 15